MRQLRHDDTVCICHGGARGHRYRDQWGDAWHSAIFESLEANRQYALRWSGGDVRYADLIVRLLAA